MSKIDIDISINTQMFYMNTVKVQNIDVSLVDKRQRDKKTRKCCFLVVHCYQLDE